MAEFIDETQVVVTAKDETGPGLASAAKNTEKAAQKMTGMLGEKAGKAMSQFNEKTEKGRQLLTTFGGAMGGTAGNAVYYAGTLSYVAGRFSALELGIMAGIAGVVAMGKALYDFTYGPLNKARESVEKITKEINTLLAANTKLIESFWMGQAGWNQFDKSASETKIKLSLAENEVAKLTDRYRELYQSMQPEYRAVIPWEKYIGSKKDLVEAQSLVRQLTASIKELEKTSEVKRYVDKKAEKTTAARSGAGQKLRPGEDAKGMLEAYARDQALSEEGAWAEGAMETTGQTEAQQQAAWTSRLKAESAALDASVAAERAAEEEKIRIKLEAEEEKMAIADEYSGMAIDLLDAVLSAEEGGVMRALSVQLKALGRQNLYEGLTEMARGIALLFTNPAEAGARFQSAAQHAAIAAALGAAGAATGGSAGGGAAAAKSSAASQIGQSRGSREEKEQVIYNFYITGHQVLGSDADRIFADGAQNYVSRQNPGTSTGRL